MGVSKIILGGTVRIDLTADTVAASSLLAGVTAHGADGEALTGTMQPATYSVDGTTLTLTSATVDGTTVTV